MKSKTPRTDERDFAAIDLKPSSRVVYSSFARQLETELAEARAEIERLKAWLNENHEMDAMTIRNHANTIEKRDAEIKSKNALIEQMRVALAWLYQWTKNEVEHFGAAAPDDEIIKDVEAALSAAERGE